jgi:hypothetical protein
MQPIIGTAAEAASTIAIDDEPARLQWGDRVIQ